MTTLASHLLLFLADALAKITLALLLTALVVTCLRRASAAVRHDVWAFGLVCALCLPGISQVIPSWQATRIAPVSFAAYHPASTFPFAAPARLMPPPPSASVRLLSPAPFPWPTLLVLGWLLGIVFLLGRLAAGLWSVRWVWRASQAMTVGLPPLRLGSAIVHRAAGAAAIRGPMTWGVWQPVILLPAEAQAWSSERLRAALLHELAHIERQDWLVQRLAQFACAMFWFHPLVWWAARRLRAEAETACDDQVLGAGMEAADYAQHLLQIARGYRCASRQAVGVVAMAEGSRLEQRIHAILASDLSRATRQRRAFLITATASCVLSIALASLHIADAQSLHPAFQGHPIIVIDPGHGGQDTGAVAPDGTMEKTINLAVALKLRTELEQRGATVYLTRSDDTYSNIGSRDRFAEQKHADYLISLHCDYWLEPTAAHPIAGTLAYYHGSNSQERLLAQDISRSIRQNTTFSPNLAVSDETRFLAGFGVLRMAAMPAVLVECGYLNNPQDLARLHDPQDQQSLATGIADGLAAYQRAGRPKEMPGQ